MTSALKTRRALLFSTTTLVLSAALIFTSNHVQNNSLAILLLLFCVVIAPFLFIPLFYSRVIRSKSSKLFCGGVILLYTFYLLELFSLILIPYKSKFDQGLLDEARKRYPYIEFKGDSIFNRAIKYPEKKQIQPKAPLEYRIFLLGGSTVTGGNPPISEIIQHKFLEAGYSNVYVYNMGVISSNVNMELARVVYEVSDYSPDLIIFYDGGNDIISPYTDDPRPGYPFNFCAYEKNVFFNVNNYPAIALIAYKSNLLRVLFKDYFANQFGNQNQLRKQVNYLSESWENEIAQNYVSAIYKTDKIAKAFGAEFAVFLQPMVYYKNMCSASTENIWKMQDSSQYFYNLRLRKKILNRVDSVSIADFFDLTSIYNNDTTEYFIDCIHTNQSGIEIVANNIFNTISKHYAVPKPTLLESLPEKK
ncbi:MAG: SGNH/GDSL hydrolase family protein [Chitinophagales bacterium]|nr:SGNH/GDSL hydrolase family protein [Chitinophagales bacterium]